MYLKNYNKNFICFIILNNIFFKNIAYAFCESKYNNKLLYNTYNITIISERFNTEIGNSLSSFIYSIIGLYGLKLKNHNFNYYILMNIFILMGISSALHHFFILIIYGLIMQIFFVLNY